MLLLDGEYMTNFVYINVTESLNFTLPYNKGSEEAEEETHEFTFENVLTKLRYNQNYEYVDSKECLFNINLRLTHFREELSHQL